MHSESQEKGCVERSEPKPSERQSFTSKQFSDEVIVCYLPGATDNKYLEFVFGRIRLGSGVRAQENPWIIIFTTIRIKM